MAKKSKVDQLLGATDAGNLQHIAIGSFLSYFIFLGAFITTDSSIQILFGVPSAFARGEGEESVVIELDPPGTWHGANEYVPTDETGGRTEPIYDCDYSGGCGPRDPFYNETDPSEYPTVPTFPIPNVPCNGLCDDEEGVNRVKRF